MALSPCRWQQLYKHFDWQENDIIFIWDKCCCLLKYTRFPLLISINQIKIFKAWVCLYEDLTLDNLKLGLLVPGVTSDDDIGVFLGTHLWHQNPRLRLCLHPGNTASRYSIYANDRSVQTCFSYVSFKTPVLKGIIGCIPFF